MNLGWLLYVVVEKSATTTLLALVELIVEVSLIKLIAGVLSVIVNDPVLVDVAARLSVKLTPALTPVIVVLA